MNHIYNYGNGSAASANSLSAVQPETEVQAQLRYLSDAVDAADQIARILEDRIASALAVPTPSPPVDTRALPAVVGIDRPVQSPLGVSLSSLTSRIKAISDRLGYMSDRVAL